MADRSSSASGVMVASALLMSGHWALEVRALGAGHSALEVRALGTRRRGDRVASVEMVPSSEVRSFRDLLVWEEAMKLAVAVHKMAVTIGQDKAPQLGRELARSATSIPSNIAEGFNRHSRASYRLHIAIALGSTGELETQLELAKRLECLSTAEATRLLNSCGTVGRLLQGLWRSLRMPVSK